MSAEVEEIVVNADFIAHSLTPHSPDASAFEAGRMMLRRIRRLRDERRTFGFETTLASKTFAPFLSEAQAVGYVVCESPRLNRGGSRETG